MDKTNSYLDKIRNESGLEQCKTAFYEAYKRSGGRVVSLLNDRDITFPCLFALLPQIEDLRLWRYLNNRNTTVLKIINQILLSPAGGMDYLSVKRDFIHSILKWIFETGRGEDIDSDDYEKVLEVISSVLIGIYKDNSILSDVADMIFKWNKNGRYIHDLAWSLFKSHDIAVLKLIAKRISSPDQEESELARSLLNIEENESYESYSKWLEENAPFLYFTDESFQYSSNPVICRVDLERKYLYKENSSHEFRPITLSDDREKNCLEVFKSQAHEDKKILSEYSYKIHNKDAIAWEKWLHSPISDQISAAKAELEVL